MRLSLPGIAGAGAALPVVFAANYFGRDVVESFLKLMPHWLTHSFEIMGGILPALEALPSPLW
ncbi:PTS sugar transporter subunit IIC [Serratia ureilytica]